MSFRVSHHDLILTGQLGNVMQSRRAALAARRHGIKVFILPALNEPDTAELPPEVQDDMGFVPVHALEEVLKVALPREPSPT